MATFSQQFLANLGRPAMGESLFGLGRAIGGLPGQAQDRRKREQFNQLMQQGQAAMASGNATQLAQVGQQLAAAGYQKEAQQFSTASTAAREKQKRQEIAAGLLTGDALQDPTALREAGIAMVNVDPERAIEFGQTASALKKAENIKRNKKAAAIGELQGFMQDPRVSKTDKLQVRNVLQGLVTGQTDVEAVETQLVQFRDRFKPRAVGSRAAPVKVEVMERQPDGTMQKVTKLAQQDPVTGELTFELVGLTPPKEFAPKDEVTRGDIAQSARKKWGEIMDQSSKASTSMIRTNDLIQKIQAEPDKATGLISAARTAILDTLGLRDAEEVNKTAALRQINSKIVGDLPPGVASDRDIAIFSQGFPTGNASSQEILDYLQVEARFLAIAQDQGILAEQFLENQMTKGQDATFVGFLERQQAYSTGLLMLEQKIQEEVSRGIDPVQAQTMMVQQFRQAFGFVPSFYR